MEEPAEETEHEEIEDLDGVPATHSELLRAALLWNSDHFPDPNYHLACFSISGSEGDQKVHCILITEVNSRLLIAVPFAAWNRSVSQRLLPAKALSKTVSVALQAAELRREKPLVGVFTKAWIGLLNPDYEELIELDVEGLDCIQFWSEDGTLQVTPLAAALVEVADEKFCFATAASTMEGSVSKNPVDSRLSALETSMMGIQGNLQTLMDHLKPQLDGAQPKTASSSNQRRPMTVPKTTTSVQPGAQASFPGLDPTVVQAALRSGVESSRLAEMSKLIQRKGGKLGDVKAAPAKSSAAFDILGESEDEVAANEEAEAAGPGGLSSLDPVGAAVVQLTSIVASMNEKKKVRDFDDILDESANYDAGGQSLISSGNQRRQAAVLRALQRGLAETPELILQRIEGLMLADFGSRAEIPGEPNRSGSYRGWLEHRSRIPNIAATVKIAWSVAGALDALRADRPKEAAARLGLLLACLDQVACDRGQWILANELLLEPSPPFASFARHQPPDWGENPHTRLADPRWIEALMFRVKELDDYAERKLKLGRRNKAEDSKDADKPNPKSAAGKAKSAGKGKKGSNSPGNAETATQEKAA